MSYTKELLEKDKVKFVFDVDSKDWADAQDRAYNKIKGKCKIEGFRPGHAPRKMVEKVYGVGVIYDEALDDIMQKEYEKAMDAEKEVFPVDSPEVSREIPKTIILPKSSSALSIR